MKLKLKFSLIRIAVLKKIINKAFKSEKKAYKRLQSDDKQKIEVGGKTLPSI